MYEKAPLSISTTNADAGGSRYEIRLETKPPLRIVGERIRTTREEDAATGAVFRLMNSFLAGRASEVAGRLNEPEFYGVLDLSEFPEESGRYGWIAGVEASAGEPVPAGMAELDFPALLYVVFRHRGTVDSLPGAFDYFYRSWLPDSGYEPAAPYAFQHYGAGFRGPFDPSSEIDVYFPVRAKPGRERAQGQAGAGMRFGAVFVPVRDMRRAAEWYCAVLGLPLDPAARLEEPTIYSLNVGGVTVLLDNIGAAPNGNPNAMFYWKVADLEGAYARLRELGADLATTPEEMAEGGISFVVRDPDGNRIVIHRDEAPAAERTREGAPGKRVADSTLHVPPLFYDGGAIDLLFDHHERAIDWFVDHMGWQVRQKEQWKPDPRASEGRMTHMGHGTWLVSALTATRLPHHYAERGTVDPNVRWCWRIGDFERTRERLVQSGVRVSPIYAGPGGHRYFDFWATLEGVRLTAQEDVSLTGDTFTPSWTRVGVTDLERSIHWYRRHTGMVIEQSCINEGYVTMSLGVNHRPGERSLWVLERLPESAFAEKTDGAVRPYCFIHGRESFMAYHRGLREAGVDVSDIGGFSPKGLAAFHFYDPDGNRFNVSSF
ncbi:VOC family protein [Paenibacillus flagellatus]|uniref:VOC domain-containing protein n=1 Tax=Paenibacillus flagellatus TaxID=2211139 RepID=A0A2V5JXJ4_9BACL|nr:VOC family protein [Paenibacillus flagellatus]PYI51569.1 hypothetical protein DLM86_24450 [Paenibacillus flagellatus]